MRRGLGWAVAFLLAVALGVAIGSELGRRRDRVPVVTLEVLPVDAGRATVGPELAADDAYVLRLELERAAYPVVAHLHGPGQAELLYPAAGLTPWPGGALIQLPQVDSGLAWRLPGTRDAQAWVVAATRDAGLDLLDLDDRIRRATRTTDSFEADLEAISRVLEDRVGPPRSLVTHPR